MKRVLSLLILAILCKWAAAQEIVYENYDGKLYGSVTSQEVADALNQQHEVQIDKRKIELSEPIRNAGDSEILISLYAGVKASMTVRVTTIK